MLLNFRGSVVRKEKGLEIKCTITMMTGMSVQSPCMTVGSVALTVMAAKPSETMMRDGGHV